MGYMTPLIAAAAKKREQEQEREELAMIERLAEEDGEGRYEYKILQTFIRRPGHVFSREQLMDVVWDEPESSMDRTVDAHIKNLRGKLKAIKPDLDPINTHRGLGYSLKENL